MKTIEQAAHAALIKSWVARKSYRAAMRRAGVDAVTAVHAVEESLSRPGLIPAPSWWQIRTHASGHVVQEPAHYRYATPHGPSVDDTHRVSFNAAAEILPVRACEKDAASVGQERDTLAADASEGDRKRIEIPTGKGFYPLARKP